VAVPYEDASGEFGTVFTQREDFAAADPVIEEILMGPGTAGIAKTGESIASGTVAIRWTGRIHARFVITASADLGSWSEIPAEMIEWQPGSYEARVEQPAIEGAFFRVREERSGTANP
jgi:hypothetical protein